MLSDKQRGYLADILRHIELAETFTQSYAYETFLGDEKTFFAVVRCFEIISEASRRLPDDFKSAHAEIEWPEMAAAGNVYRHGYGGVTHAPRVEDAERGPACFEGGRGGRAVVRQKPGLATKMPGFGPGIFTTLKA